MNQEFSIIPDLKNHNTISFNSNTAVTLGLTNTKLLTVCYGVECYEVKANIYGDIEDSDLAISQDIINKLFIPLCCRYQVKLEQNIFHIGPYIGILAFNKRENLDKNINSLLNFTYNYENIKGSIIAFSLDGVDRSNNTIDGYLFNPQKNEWEKGIYKYPSSIFKRIDLPPSWRNYLESTSKGRVFNSYVVDKWETFEWLEKYQELSFHLPYTMPYGNLVDLKWFLNTYKTVYIKPVHGSQGVGIIKVSLKSNMILVNYLENYEKVEQSFEKNLEVFRFLNSIIKTKKYIMQQPVELVTFEEKIVDFRVIVLKDSKGNWKDIGLISKYSKPGSIVSNISSGGSAELGEHALKNIFNLADDETWLLRKKISDLAIDIASKLEECGIHLGNLGIDLGIDKDKKIWLIEVNSKDPNHTIALDAGDKQMFYSAKLHNMLYAKYLAGF